MRILIACEYSGVVRNAFMAKGHDVISCDLLPSEDDSPYHYQGDVRDLLGQQWDLLIGHPPCTYNTLAGIRWMYHPDDTHLEASQRRRHPNYPNRMDDFLAGVEFFNLLKSAPIPRICLENSQPHGLAMKHIGRSRQIAQPWMFGEPYTKGAHLWLKNLPLLKPTHSKEDYEKIFAACHHASPGPDRWKERSRTYKGIAEAMATQWNF